LVSFERRLKQNMFALEATSCKGPGFADCCPQVSASSPEVFGPPLWFSLHTMASKYPENPSTLKRTSCVQFLRSLPELLPCEDCGDHFRIFMQSADLDDACGSRAGLSRLMCHAHNGVNSRTGKEAFPCEGVIERYATSALCASSGEEGSKRPDVDTLVGALRNAVMLGLQQEGVVQSVCSAPTCDGSS
jgi:Erv1 / Alr family